MPKGVEHSSEVAPRCEVQVVFLPLMPKGVEHTITGPAVQRDRQVFLPLMPKGVEHSHCRASKPRYSYSFR